MATKKITLRCPRVVAIATDKYLSPTHSFKDSAALGSNVPKYGQDFTFSSSRKLPKGSPSAGDNVAELKKRMNKLLTEFASKDKSGMAKRLFAKFLAKNKTVGYFDDSALNVKAKNHSNIKFFCNASLNKPPKFVVTGKTRIHQALKKAGWDINTMVAPKDLGVPAFNTGDKNWITRSGDFENGLGVMINGVQHGFVVATKYEYDPGCATYDITLQFRLYDVFGLDDDDLSEYGADGGIELNGSASWGINAWWQLQHQYGYAPLVTRIVFDVKHVGVPAV